eukprot:12778266-Alexandrium_andersonii.AAC.1
MADMPPKGRGRGPRAEGRGANELSQRAVSARRGGARCKHRMPHTQVITWTPRQAHPQMPS